MESLASVYWRPVYKHIRLKWRKDHDDASDLVQDFFVDLAERDLLSRFDPSRARLRTYLRVCVDGLVSNAAKAGLRVKRGGGAAHLSLDFEAVRDELERSGPGAGESPEDAFEREYRRSVLAVAVERLEAQLRAGGKERTFQLFAAHDLSAEVEPPSYAALSERFGVSVSDVTNQLSLARRELKRIAIALLEALSGSDEELRAEARALLGQAAREAPRP